MKIVLASGSPRRAKILEAHGVDFEVVKTDAPEVSYDDDPERTVRENALAKGAAAHGRHVLSADTIVWFANRIYGKPRDLAEAKEFLRELSGQTHVVFTGVAFDGEVKVAKSHVRFRALDDAAIDEYVSRVRPTDRAGAYDIDESGDAIVESYLGSYENIMGLPVEPLMEWGVVERPVGFFDSGVGGTCILDAFRRLCPDESTVYLADSANCPYGNRPADEIVRIAEANVEWLLARGCKMVVVACNTATAAAIDHLRAKYRDIPFVGLEPAVKPAALQSKTGVVGVLATAGTFGGRLYRETKEKFAKDVTVLATVADEFVDLVERGETEGPSAERTVRAKIEPLLAAGCDKIVLGCTHFPHLKPLIGRIAAGRAEVVDPSDAVARQARRVLASRGLLSKGASRACHEFVRTPTAAVARGGAA